jgi:putative membrane protein
VLTAISDHPLDLTDDSVRLAAERTALAVERTRLAHERTLMAWVRTATSLISFGFTIYKTFQYLQDQQGSGPIRRAFTPRVFAMTMICLGVAALSLATLQHWKDLRGLYAQSGRPQQRSTS